MSLNLRASRAARVRDDAAALAQVQARLQKVLHDQAAADALLAEAKRAAEDLGQEARELQDVEQKLAAKLASSRAVLIQECVSTLPDDVLRVLFTEVVRYGGPHAPFALAAVCGRWRRVALDSALLWSKIHIVSGIYLDPRKVLSTEYDRAAILLSRSRSAPLDIKGPVNLSSSEDVLRLIRRLFNLLGAHVSRWKFASLTLADDLGTTCLDYLKGPTPLLVQLTFDGPPFSRNDIGPSLSGYLPFAPRLRELSVRYAGLGCSTGHAFPAMKKLCFYSGACTDDQVLDIIRMSGSSLQELTLYKPLARGPRATIHLPHLNYLYIMPTSVAILASTPAPAILTPTLAHLNLHGFRATDLDDNFLRFLDTVSPSVRKLTFSGKFTENQITALARLRNLEHLDLKSTASWVTDDALELLSAHNPVIWPCLECIQNLVFRQGMGASSDAILRFIASRNTSEGNENPSAARPCRLREVTFSQVVPRWLVAEVQRLLEF